MHEEKLNGAKIVRGTSGILYPLEYDRSKIDIYLQFSEDALQLSGKMRTMKDSLKGISESPTQGGIDSLKVEENNLKAEIANMSSQLQRGGNEVSEEIWMYENISSNALMKGIEGLEISGFNTAKTLLKVLEGHASLRGRAGSSEFDITKDAKIARGLNDMRKELQELSKKRMITASEKAEVERSISSLKDRSSAFVESVNGKGALESVRSHPLIKGISELEISGPNNPQSLLNQLEKKFTKDHYNYLMKYLPYEQKRALVKEVKGLQQGVTVEFVAMLRAGKDDLVRIRRNSAPALSNVDRLKRRRAEQKQRSNSVPSIKW